MGGIGNVFASLASFAWGCFKNLTCLLPVYLLAGLVLGWLHFVLLENWMAAVFVIAICFTGVATYLDWIQAKVTDPASREVSDVESRMEWARIGGWFMFGIAIGVFIILVPRAVELLREFWRGGLWSGTGVVSSIGGAIAAITGLQKFLPKSEGNFRKVASVTLTFAAIVLLAFALIAVCDFVVYGNPLAVLCHYVTECSIEELWLYVGTLVASVLFIMVCLGLRYRGMGQADLLFGFLISVGPLAALVLLGCFHNQPLSDRFDDGTKAIGKLTRPLYLLVSKPIEIKELPGEYPHLMTSLREQGDGLTNMLALQADSNSFDHTKSSVRYYGMAQTFAMDGYALIENDPLLLRPTFVQCCVAWIGVVLSNPHRLSY